MDDLTTRIQGLPPELFNKIRDFTFTPTAKYHYIDETYKPPKFLQISRATREYFAAAYYGNGTVFQMNSDWIEEFIKSLPPQHLLQIDELRWFLEEPDQQNLLNLSLHGNNGQRDNGALMFIYHWNGLWQTMRFAWKWYRRCVKCQTKLPNGTIRWSNWYELERDHYWEVES